jgi:hypothetical protein
MQVDRNAAAEMRDDDRVSSDRRIFRRFFAVFVFHFESV